MSVDSSESMKITPEIGDTPEQLHKKLLLSNELLARAYCDNIVLRDSAQEITRQFAYLLQLRRNNMSALVLTHLDAIDAQYCQGVTPKGAVH